MSSYSIYGMHIPQSQAYPQAPPYQQWGPAYVFLSRTSRLHCFFSNWSDFPPFLPSFQPTCSSRTSPSWMGHPSSATPSWLGCPTASSILRLGRPASPDAIGPHPAPGSARAPGLDDPERLGATFLPPRSPPCSCSPSILRRSHLLLHSLWTCSFPVCFSSYSSISLLFFVVNSLCYMLSVDLMLDPIIINLTHQFIIQHHTMGQRVIGHQCRLQL